MKVYGEVYGCSANKSDFELGMGLLKQNGFLISKNPGEADVNIIFTCSVKGPTVNRMVERIKQLKKYSKPLIVAGCLTKTERELIEKIAPNASLLGPNSVGKIVDVAAKTIKGKKVVVLAYSKNPLMPKMRINKIIDIIQIATGCLSSCTFCSTRIARGLLKSFRPNEIREAVINALQEGCKEIWLTSQDNSAYGRDIGITLADLLFSIALIKRQFFVRVGMMNPLHFEKAELQQLINAFSLPKIFKFLHLCVQSGSNKVLKDMKRGYTKQDFLSYVKMFREKIPRITLATDVIVGYPTETKEDFEQTYELIKEVKPDVVNISRFWPRKGTEASKLEQLPAKEVMRRSKKMHLLVKKIMLEKNKEWIGWKGNVLVDEKGKDNSFISRNIYYKPIIIKSDKDIFGKIVKVEITGAKSNYLIGQLL